MFSVNHFIWVAISVTVIVGALYLLKKHKLPLQKLLTIACVCAVISELVKTFSNFQIVAATGDKVYLFLSPDHIPLHFCSIQILLIFWARFTKNQKLREILLAFMYPTCAAGAAFAIALPTIFTDSIEVSQAFTHPLAYQFFLYHSLLIVLGLYIAMCGEVHIRPRHMLYTLEIIGVFAFVSLYLNSIFAMPVYENGALVSVEYTTNFFFTYRPPIDIEMTELWHWYIYWLVLISLVVLLLTAFYLPYILKSRKAAKEQKNA